MGHLDRKQVLWSFHYWMKNKQNNGKLSADSVTGHPAEHDCRHQINPAHGSPSMQITRRPFSTC